MTSIPFYAFMDSPLGKLILTADNSHAITGLYTSKDASDTQAWEGMQNPKIFQRAFKQLEEYFKGKRKVFDLSLAPQGTIFQKRVWKALQDIPYGVTKSYAAVARALYHPKAARAVGMANAKNPICIIIPCHRVIASSGQIGGYNGGIAIKQWLLNHEQKN